MMLFQIDTFDLIMEYKVVAVLISYYYFTKNFKRNVCLFDILNN